MAVRVSVFFIVLTTFTTSGRSQLSSPLAGVWEMVSQSYNGEPRSFDGRKLKVLTPHHFVWVAQDREYALNLLERKTERDSLEAYCGVFGAGTYEPGIPIGEPVAVLHIAGELSDSAYTERLELFYDPAYIGRTLTFTFRCDGGIWYMQGEFPLIGNEGATKSFLLEEVWRRIE